MMWLDTKYASLLGGQLSKFKKLRNNVYNFRCPICGDSDKDQTKCRGYFYAKKNGLRYKCHNCGANESFYKFLEVQNPTLFHEYKMELFKERGSTRKVVKQEVDYAARKAKRRTTQKPSNRTTQKPSNAPLMGMECVGALDSKHDALKWLKARMVPSSTFSEIYFVEKMADVAHTMDAYKETKFDRYPRVVFPFYNSEGVLTHLQGRAIVDVPKSKRYITLEIEDAPKVYGANKVDKSKEVLVVEGPIDSLFLPNCVGMGGADVDFNSFHPSTTTFIFDNERRNSEIVKRMARVADMGYGVCVWGKELPDNDINDMVLAGMDLTELAAYIKSHTFRGLRAKMAITDYSLV